MSRTRKTPRRIRSDGWTLPRQRTFIKMLAITGSVDKAASFASMSAPSAYRLRLHPDGAAFRFAWDAALKACASTLREIAFERAINGTRVPVFENGKIVGRNAVFNDRLLMFLLRRYDREQSRGPEQLLLDSVDRLVEADDPGFEDVRHAPDGDDDDDGLAGAADGPPGTTDGASGATDGPSGGTIKYW